MPHPLPGDVAGVDGMRYFLVALPDDSAFLRAALAIYSELENAYKWGLEGQVVPDSEIAAQKWAAAVAETVRLIQMAWPDQVLSYIDQVEQILRALQLITGGCCDSDPSDGGLYTDPVVDGVGSVPQEIIDAGYATDANDWEGFASYKCMIAHVAVDDIQAKLLKLAPLLEAGGTVIGGVATIIGIITAIFTSGLTAMAAGILATTGAAATIYSQIASGVGLEALAAKVADKHEILACAFMLGDGVDGSISELYAAIDAEFTDVEGLVLKNLNTGPVIRALYSGRYNQQDIAAALEENGYVASSFNCDCIEEEFGYHFAGSTQGLIEDSLRYWTPGYYNIIPTGGGGVWRVVDFKTGNQIKDQFDLVAVPTIRYLKFRVFFHPGASTNLGFRVAIVSTTNVTYNLWVATTNSLPDSSPAGYGVWVERTVDLGGLVQLHATNNAFFLYSEWEGGVSTDFIQVDYIIGYQ